MYTKDLRYEENLEAIIKIKLIDLHFETLKEIRKGVLFGELEVNAVQNDSLIYRS